MNSGEETTFWKFLKEHSICIPIIQRDYAQGRKDKEELRKRFLKDLKLALDADNGSLMLDFAYGSFEESTFYPLDGQQRLTTLWLLHWYIAYIVGELNDENVKIFQKFSYATRVSARDFCNKLCELAPLSNGQTDIIAHIKNQTWFYSYWNQDPTVQSMLRMIQGTLSDGSDGISGVFQFQDGECSECRVSICTDYWKKLTTTQCVQFRVLDISTIGQTDDLYVKMNARGKPLTSFENFKAELVNYIQQQTTFMHDDKWKELGNPQRGFVQKLDNAWTDIFWDKRSTDANSKKTDLQNHIDEIYFTFINRFWYNISIVTYKNERNELVAAKEFEINGKYSKLYGNSNEDWKLNFENLNNYFPEEQCEQSQYIIITLEKILDNYNKYSKKLGTIPLPPLWDVNIQLSFIPEYTIGKSDNYDDKDSEILNIQPISQPERCVFFAVCKFLENIPSTINEAILKLRYKDWMHIAWNIVENANIKTVDTMVSIIRLLNELSNHIYDEDGILGFLANEKSFTLASNAVKEQIQEEREKAKRIMYCRTCSNFCPNCGLCTIDYATTPSWENKIESAEKFTFFHGSIRFLYRDGNGKANWQYFEQKWENVQKYFDKNGVKQQYARNALLMRALMSRIIDESSFANWSYTPNNDKNVWHDILLSNNSALVNAVHNLLLVSEMYQLEEYIMNPLCCSNWVYDLVKTNILALDEFNKGERKLESKGPNVKALHEPRKWTHYLFSYEGNRILNTAIKERQIQLSSNCRQINDSANSELLVIAYYNTPNIDFKYQDFSFRYDVLRNYIYLMNESHNNEKISKKDFKQGNNDINNYFCFEINNQNFLGVNVFYEKLKELIKEYNSDQQ